MMNGSFYAEAPVLFLKNFSVALQPSASSPMLVSGGESMNPGSTQWTFYGTSDHRPSVGQFVQSMEELGFPVIARTRQMVDGVLVGYAAAEPRRELLQLPLTLTLTGKAGELNLRIELSSHEDVKRLNQLRFPKKPPPEQVTIVADVTAVDEAPGRSYRNMVRGVLLLLGEFFPKGVVERVNDGAVFQTVRMRKRYGASDAELYHFEGFLHFPADLLDVVQSSLESDPLWVKLCALSGGKLSFHSAPSVLQEADRERCLEELTVLARHAQSGAITVTGPSGFLKTIQ